MTTPSSEKILIVESDPEIRDLIGRQTLAPFGYQVSLAADGPDAIRQAAQLQPDVLITNLNLPGLSGKDLLVALSSQGMIMPMIVMAEKGQETNVIQAFRLGASDYLMLPIREAEVLNCVERALEEGRDIRAREQHEAQLKQANTELERRVRDLSTISTVGRALVATTDQRALVERIVAAMATVTESDLGWLTLKDEKTNSFVLVASHNLPADPARKNGQPLEFGPATPAAGPVQTLIIQGPAFQKLQISALGQSAMIVPLKIKKETAGLLTLVRKGEKPFSEADRSLAEGIARYASTALVNARLFQSLTQNVETARRGEKVQR